jgi:biopolymer transport protein ExbD
MGMSSSDDSDFNTTINVVPLVDIMLVLLIIFIITLPVMTHAVKIDLPRATNDPPPDHPPPVLNIDVQYDGSVMLNGNAVSMSELSSYVKGAAANDPQPDVHLAIDRRTKYEYAADVLFTVQRGGLKKIGFVADSSGSL